MAEEARVRVDTRDLSKVTKENRKLESSLRNSIRDAAKGAIGFREGLEQIRAGTGARALTVAAGAGGILALIGAVGGVANQIGQLVLRNLREDRSVRSQIKEAVSGFVPQILSETLPALLDESNRRRRAEDRSREIARAARADLASRLVDDPNFAEIARQVAAEAIRQERERIRLLEAAGGG